MNKPIIARHPYSPLALLMAAALTLPIVGSGPMAGDDDNGAMRVLVKTRVPMTPEVAAAIGAHGQTVSFVWPEINAMALHVSPAGYADLAADPNVELIEPDQQGEVPAVPVPESVVASWGAYQAETPAPEVESVSHAWNQDMADTVGSGYDGTGVTVAVIDSGLPHNWEAFLPADAAVDLEHAAGFGAEGWGGDPSGKNGVDGVGGYTGQLSHGLAVTSVLLGFPTPDGLVGGAAPGVTILPVNVLSQFNSGWFSWFAAAIMHVGRLKADGVLTGPVVINFSIQARFHSQILASAIDYAVAHGVIFVTIAGNFGPAGETISFPGRLPQSITAGAAGWTDAYCFPWSCTDPFADVPENDTAPVYVAPYSGRESSPPVSPTLIDVLAPGIWVYGEWLTGPGYSDGQGSKLPPIANYLFGTSFAAPHVAGIVAQMLQKNPSLTQAQVESILRGTALPIPADPDGAFPPFQFIPPWGPDATGSGLARGTAAVAATPAP